MSFLGYLRELSLRRRLGPPIIVVSGLPRSGTSMMMNMLRAADLEVVTDDVRTADRDNPKGYFEDERVKQLDKAADKAWLRPCRGKVVKIISFLLKDLPADNYYKVILMRRNLEEVIASQNKMLANRDEPRGNRDDDEKMIRRYQMHLRKTEFLLEEEKYFDHIDIQYREAIDQPRTHAERICKFLRMRLDVGKMVQAVDKSLYRNRAEP